MQRLQSFWFIKSDELGKVAVGKQSDAADNAAILVDGSGSLVPANWVLFDKNAFWSFRSKGAPTGWPGAACPSAVVWAMLAYCVGFPIYRSL